MNSRRKWSDSLCSSQVSMTPESDAFGNGRQEGWEGLLPGRGLFL